MWILRYSTILVYNFRRILKIWRNLRYILEIFINFKYKNFFKYEKLWKIFTCKIQVDFDNTKMNSSYVGDSVEYSYAFVSSLIANAFFSTYPKRTAKTHPTLRDFNFTNFFRHLHKWVIPERTKSSKKSAILSLREGKKRDKLLNILSFSRNAQKAKLKSIFHYYNYLETEQALDGRLIISRQVCDARFILIYFLKFLFHILKSSPSHFFFYKMQNIKFNNFAGNDV